MKDHYPASYHTIERKDSNLEFFESTKALTGYLLLAAEWLIVIGAVAYGSAKLKSSALHLVYLCLYFGFVLNMVSTLGAWYRKNHWPRHVATQHKQSSFRRRLSAVVVPLIAVLAAGFALEFVEKVIDDIVQSQNAGDSERVERSKKLGPDWMLPN